MRAIAGIWHWRHNPLRRRTDRWEAWLALMAALLIAVGAPCAGWFAGRAAHGALLEAVRLQREQRHLVWATVDRPASPNPVDPDPESASQHHVHLRVIARWPGPGGAPRTGEVIAPRPVETGDRFRMWADERGRAVPRPMDEETAATHAVLAGLGCAAAVGGLVEGGRRLVVRQLMARRFRRWDAAWARAGQDWGRAGAGS
ncbi:MULTISPECIES: Rv1733c family protein [unclassified Streptomyces]|uniref:Rv1733c family protein n=1 Tax=unclassified Streptomyces TaxID=2593676 RepID=UPI000C27FB08|nr:hypothetical protein [Streptomyces sp. CB02959]PJN38086.1 hypothetical protein CG747_24670 [Streptomyces sp. CB02959]